jgi:hypothetical protein
MARPQRSLNTGVARVTFDGEPALALADLLRLPGLRPEYARLLARAGVRSRADLRSRRPRPLADALLVANTERPITRLVPPEAVLGGWIEQAARTTDEESPPRS